jgi:hypothetical protein
MRARCGRASGGSLADAAGLYGEAAGRHPDTADQAPQQLDVFDKSVIHRCQQHYKITNVIDKLPDRLRSVTERRMRPGGRRP